MSDTIDGMTTTSSRKGPAAVRCRADRSSRDEGLELIAPNGLLTGLTKQVLETTLEAEMTDHLGYESHDSAGLSGENSATEQESRR